ncbi:MAG: formylglycine-generating enzyme family protein [Aquabacterium sp.]|uniref:formylglycine-generating enzyme family protein n=1 Tax=Aquabacterium sp. TaxID=1872578 RepID=UPI003BCF904E
MRHLLALTGLWLCALPFQAVAVSCPAYTSLPSGWRVAAHAGQVEIQPGSFIMGTALGYADERPPTPTAVGRFWIDRTEVTNAQFASFVRATGYQTDAERQGGGAVFVKPDASANSKGLTWWRFVKGANWRHPSGPGSHIQGRERYPVTLVTQADALAYAKWLGRDLPTEAEWEYAAKAGASGPQFETTPRNAKNRPAANYWQGNFPLLDTAEDGFSGLAPVACFDANPWGLYDMVGNAWEWTKDTYRGDHQAGHANGDPEQARPDTRRRETSQPPKVVIKGGSYLCSPDYCVRYRASARESQEPDMPTSHVGFRTVSR